MTKTARKIEVRAYFMVKTALGLFQKIKQKTARVGIIGVGYVGSALGLAAAERGFSVVGYGRSDKSVNRIHSLHCPNFTASTDIKTLATCDIFCICVPTPVYKNRRPDLTPIRQATRAVSRLLKPGKLIILESSVAPGTTRSLVLPLLGSKFRVEKDFFLAFSPERIDPGNKDYTFTNIPKVVAGFGKYSTKLAVEFYQRIVTKVHPVSSLEVAELSKILENTFRLVNISLVNEMADYAAARNIDIWETIEAAKTKPFGFLAHYPGPGIGGHCIPVDPYYLLDDARKRGISLSIIESAGKINTRQPLKVVHEALKILKNGQAKKEQKVLLVGVAYKPNIDDTRESAALVVWDKLRKKGLKINYHDPHIPAINGTKNLKLSLKNLNLHDLIIILTHHRDINYKLLQESDVPVLDTRNVLTEKRPHLYQFTSSSIGDILDSKKHG